jgi:transposase
MIDECYQMLKNVDKIPIRSFTTQAKTLTLMNLRLSNVLSNITGNTGIQIVNAILLGERDPKVMTEYRHGECAKSAIQIAKSLLGHYKH